MAAPEKLFRDFGDGSAVVIHWPKKKFANSSGSIIQHSGEGNVVLMRDHWLKALAQDFGIEDSLQDNFVESVLTLAEEFQRKSQMAKLPERPVRDFAPRRLWAMACRWPADAPPNERDVAEGVHGAVQLAS
jgi:hypothetical protein